MDSLRIAAAVVNAPIGKIDHNLAQVTRWTRMAAEQEVRLICFPEMNLTGYVHNETAGDWAQSIPGPATHALAELARETGVTILAGMAEKDTDGRLFIVHLAANPDGRLDVYRKLHLAPPEQAIFTPGDEVSLFEVASLTCGIQLCYDAHFPELTTRMALGGADIIFVPHASPSRGQTARDKHKSWMRHLTARSYDNGLFIVACNQTGRNGNGLEFPGNAVVIDPSGNILAKKLDDKEGLVVVDLEGSALEHVRGHRMRYFLPNRRPDMY